MNGLIFDDATCEFVAPPAAVAIPMPRLRDYIQIGQAAPDPSPITLTDIKRAVCEHYGLRLGDMTSQAKPNSIVHPRQLAMYLSRKLTTRSYPEIGRSFGGKHHTTAIHAHGVVTARLALDPEARADHDAILEALGE